MSKCYKSNIIEVCPIKLSDGTSIYKKSCMYCRHFSGENTLTVEFLEHVKDCPELCLPRFEAHSKVAK